MILEALRLWLRSPGKHEWDVMTAVGMAEIKDTETTGIKSNLQFSASCDGDNITYRDGNIREKHVWRKSC